jgi:Fe-coproporphyrin III synthase
MCDIWKNRITNEMAPEEYLRLPDSLTEINITGGEPFLRRDLVAVVANIKKAAPRARLVMSSNGFLPHRVEQDLPKILSIDPAFALRISIDGIGKAHDAIRRIPGGFEKITRTLHSARSLGVRDLGVGLTVMNNNINEIPRVRSFCKTNKLEFSVTVVTNSPMYFGEEKEKFRPVKKKALKNNLKNLARDHIRTMRPSEIARGWFVTHLLEYIQTGKRALPCDAGSGFFYMDSTGNVYTCHMKPWIMGNLRTNSAEQIFSNNRYAARVAACNSCWMVCTAKSMMKKKLHLIIPEMAPRVIAAILGGN